MKKGTKILNGIKCRKRRAGWTVLILILSLISISVIGSGNSINSQGDSGLNPEQKAGVDSTDKTLEQKQGNNSTDWTENQENNEELEQEDNTGIERTGNSIKTKEESEQEDNGSADRTENQEKAEEKTEQKQVDNDNKEGSDNQENVRDELEIKKEDTSNTDSTDNQESDIEKIEQKQEENSNIDSTSNQESNEENLKSNAENLESNAENPENNEENPENNEEKTGQKLEDNNNTDKKDNQEYVRDELEQKKEDTSSNTDSNIDSNTDSIDNQESDKEKIEQKQEENNSTGSTIIQETDEEKTGQKQEDNNSTDNNSTNKKDNQESDKERIEPKQEDNNNIKSTDNKESNEEKIEQNIRACNGTKSLENAGTKSEIKISACNGIQNPENEGIKTEINQSSFNMTCLPAEEITPEVEPEIFSWTNMKFILEYPYSINSFYTTQETVDIYYNGPEALSQQKVGIYLVKERNLCIPEETVTDAMDEKTISFDEVFNNAESYIQIPANLNEGGDLPPLTLGPLPAGNYWVLITLAGNETKTTESEKQILFANNFEVLEYEMRVKAPATLKEGENFEINMELKNSSAQESYTYWAVLIREDAYRANINNGFGGGRTKIDPFLKDLDIVKFFDINSTNSDSKASEAELKNKIQALIGEGNGTISLGEENQTSLSLTSLDLSPGNYILFAGAYEKNKGLVGIVQEELTITAASARDSSKSYSLEHNSDTPPIIRSKASVPATLKTEESIFETIKTFRLDELQSHIKGRAMEVIRNPPKLPSFLIGFTGTLLLVFTIMKKRK